MDEQKREQIMNSVACPACRVPLGQPCRYIAPGRWSYSAQHQFMKFPLKKQREVLARVGKITKQPHSERRAAYEKVQADLFQQGTLTFDGSGMTIGPGYMLLDPEGLYEVKRRVASEPIFAWEYKEPESALFDAEGKVILDGYVRIWRTDGRVIKYFFNDMPDGWKEGESGIIIKHKREDGSLDRFDRTVIPWAQILQYRITLNSARVSKALKEQSQGEQEVIKDLKELWEEYKKRG